MSCTATRHDTLTAYKEHCRCPKALRAGARAQKRYRTRVARGERFHTDATGTRRRIQALARIGWRASDIAERLGTTPANVCAFGVTRQQVFVTTANRIRAIYAELAEVPGPSRLAASRAAAKGWLAPEWWDDTLMDDPSYEPPTDTTVHWSDVDPVAVERACQGDQVPLTRAERIRAVIELRERGANDCEIGRRLSIDPKQVWRDRTCDPQQVAS